MTNNDNMITEIKYRNNVLRIFYDNDVMDSPRDWDNLGTMICFHSKYILGDKHEFNDTEEFLEFLKNKDILVKLPLYLLDHSGLTLRTSQFYEDVGGWDSGLVGFIYCNREKIIENFGKDYNINEVKSVLECEVKTYNQYLRGEIYRYELIKLKKCSECNHVSEELLDSMGNIYDVKSIFDFIQNAPKGLLEKVKKEVEQI